MPSQEIKRHWSRVADIGCVISQTPNPTLHHCHGGSITTELGKVRGMSQKPSDWLVIPIAALYHVGLYGIDSGDKHYGVVANWEDEFGTQYDHLMTVCDYVGYDVFERAGFGRRWQQ